MALIRKTTISNKKIIITVPVLFALVLYVIIVSGYVERIKSDIKNEFHQFELSLIRTVKIVSSLDYSVTSQFSSYSKLGEMKHHIEVDNGLCKAWPIDDPLLSSQTAYVAAVDMNYMILGPERLCTEGSPLHEIATRRLTIAPILSFLHDLDTYLEAVHFASADGYVITSPERVANSIDKSIILSVTELPFWEKTEEHLDVISVVGPHTNYIDENELISFSSPVVFNDRFQGAVLVNVSVSKLLNTSVSKNRNYRIIDRNSTSLPSNAYLVHNLNVEGVNFSHSFYYALDLKEEVIRFFIESAVELLTVTALLIISIIGLFYLKTRFESRYFKELAEKDPMTGLLNRRGLELHCRLPSRNKIYALGIYDVDDFKKINDTFGHDKGDEVLCHVANSICDSVRDTDAVARFGGEEFVVFLKGDNQETMVEVLRRVREVVVDSAYKALESGYTISGGVATVSTSEFDFETLFKQADEKLYTAKTTGKNQVVV